ncbi:hypothetical protein GCM10011409_22030 [Lentibacillus populi]|uniref:Uncharacterized protein n=1 Tax=Lentibacillus populi TaxID=1827502 RepID=A0A9W5X5I8_9BACI|nr:hypothetical protein GCM10011409_22030 [Lentibacillus populi]
MIAPWISTLNTVVDPPISLGVIARKFLRSTLPCVDAGNAPLAGQCPNGNNNDRLLRASIVIGIKLDTKQRYFCVKLLL